MDAIALTQALVRLDSVNPPGNEHACATLLAGLLEQAGFETRLHELAAGRSSVVATIGNRSGQPRLAFTGHIDTVPLGAAPWQFDPFGGEIHQGRLYGRGSSDMKSGVAAFVAAAVRNADWLRETAGVSLVITAGEETGCDGARALAAAGVLPGAVGALVVGEPTANQPVLGHKGALWLRACAHGIAAHGSMPEKGENAIFKLARAACALEDYRPAGQHYFFGRSTLNVGTFSGGVNINSVPDRAEMGVDIRTVPGDEHAEIVAAIEGRVGTAVRVETLLDLAPVHTSESHPWVRRLAATVAARSGARVSDRAASYFTDASVLRGALGGVPTVILGPGEPTMAHQTDEFCVVDCIAQAVEIYDALIRDWLADAK